MKALWGRVAIALAMTVFMQSVSVFAAEDEKQDMDPKTIRTVKVKCDTSGADPVMGRKGCNAQFKEVTALTRKRISAFVWNYYHGKIVDQATGQITPTPMPSCNLSAGEVDGNMFSQACGNMCEFKVHTSLVPPSGGVDPKGKPPE